MPATTRPRSQSGLVIVAMRQKILGGSWEPGARIPIKPELCRQFGASDGTIQTALDRLATEGFLRSRGRLGTFVCDHPPHLSRIGLVFETPEYSNIWAETLAGVARQFVGDESKQFKCYFDCSMADGMPSPGVRELEDDLVHGRLAGLVLTGSPLPLMGTEVLRRQGVARVCIGNSDLSTTRAIPTIEFASPDSLAMKLFRDKGRKRLGLFTTFQHSGAQTDLTLQCANKHGLATHRRWVHYLEPHSASVGRPIAELLMSLPACDRPDAIYVNDDHLINHVALGIADSGRRVPDELDLISHVNFPTHGCSAVPVTRLGIDNDALLRTAVELLDLQLQRRQVPPVTILRHVFESELTPVSVG